MALKPADFLLIRMYMYVGIYFAIQKYKQAIIGKRRNQKEILTQKTEVGKQNRQSGTHTKKTHRKPSEHLFPNRRPLNYPNLK